MTREQLIAAYVAHKFLPGNRFAGVEERIANGCICISPADDLLYVAERYSYITTEQALAALNRWDGTGEPQGWIRHQPSDRRRPDGDASREYTHS